MMKRKYKLYFADSGLLVAMLDEEAQVDLKAIKILVYTKVRFMRMLSEKHW